MKKVLIATISCLGFLAGGAYAAKHMAGEQPAMDAKAAEELATKNKCTMCHAVDQKKMGPSMKDIAAKYKDDKDAVAKLSAMILGGDAKHPKLTASESDAKTVVQWFLSH
jgi:cytochrome c